MKNCPAYLLLLLVCCVSSVARADLEFWVADGNGATEDHLVKYNSTTGVTSVPLLDSSNISYGWPSDIIRVGSTLYGIDTAQKVLYTLNADSGLVTPIGGFSPGSASGLAYDSINHVMYMSASGQKNLFSLNMTSGASTYLFRNLLLDNIRGIAFNSSDGLLYATSAASGNILSINPATQSVNTVVSPVNEIAGNFYDELTFFDGEVYAPYVNDAYTTVQVRKINLTDGSVIDIGPMLSDVSAHTVVIRSISAVPEPAMWPALTVLGIVVILRVKLKHYWETTRS